jgi:ketosteroid isomerase-like protein
MPSIKPPLSAMATPDDTEQQFYEALQTGDFARLMAVWSDDEAVVCVHPGGPRNVGLDDVRSSFEKVLSRGPIDIHPEKIHRLAHQDTAIHSVLERVPVTTDKGPATAWMWATNVYVKTAQGWKMVLHHSSPGLMGQAAPPADIGNTLH